MIKLISMIALWLSASLMSEGAVAQRAKYRAPWGMAGCGLWGSAISGKDQGSQLGVWALRTFLIYDSQTSAITSGTSNCVEPRSRMASEEQQVFIAVNLVSLEREAAQGDGEHLWSLSEIFGCKDYEAFAKLSQNRYTSIFSTRNPDEVLRNFVREVNADRQLVDTCGRVS